MKAICWFCQKELIWQSDFDFEDYGMDGEGVIAFLVCSGCEATAEFKTKQEEV